MKRAKQLQPLSREHHLGLNLSRHAKDCADTPNEIKAHWQKLTAYIDDMRHHFQIEDNLIAMALQPYKDSVPKVAAALATLSEQHILLHKQMEQTQKAEGQPITANQVRELGSLLYEHIRFEERELFPLAETYLSQSELDAIYEASSEKVKRLDENR